MNNWNSYTLDDLVDVVIGGTPSRNDTSLWDSDKASNNVWVSIRDLGKLNSRYIYESKEYISDLGTKKSNVKLIPKDTVLMSFKLSIGKTAIAGRDLYTNEAIAGFMIKNPDQLDYEFLYHSLPLLKYEIDVAVKGNTLNKEKIQKTKILLPPISIQRKIAQIITNVDDQIYKTGIIINKTECFKNGLMRDLMTKGVNHSHFKKSKFGTIPSDWEIRLLDDVAKRGSGHTPNKKIPDYWNGGIKWVSLSDTFRLDHVYISETDKQISREGINNSSAVLHPEGIVVLSRDAGVGKSAITTEPMAVSQHFIVWKCGEKLNNLFLYYVFQLWKPVFENIATGSTIKTIGLPFFKKLEIPLPPLEEQKYIADRLYMVDSKIEKEKTSRTYLISLKNGLMNDIFSRKVQVI